MIRRAVPLAMILLGIAAVSLPSACSITASDCATFCSKSATCCTTQDSCFVGAPATCTTTCQNLVKTDANFASALSDQADCYEDADCYTITNGGCTAKP